jgi:hypothetical protein
MMPLTQAARGELLEPCIGLARGNLAEVDEHDRVPLVRLVHGAVDGDVIKCGPAEDAAYTGNAGDPRAFGVARVRDEHDAVGVRVRALPLLVGIPAETAGGPAAQDSRASEGAYGTSGGTRAAHPPTGSRRMPRWALP